MTTAPSLLSSPLETLAASNTMELPAKNLVDLLYDGFHMLLLLKYRYEPENSKEFGQRIASFLDTFERQAKKHNFSAEDIYDAKYAFCATVDEAVLSSSLAIRSDWERRPLQVTLFTDQLAGEHFFDKLEEARNRGNQRVNALEVFHMCLMLGFKGRYLLEGPEKIKYLTAQLGEQIRHIRGKAAPFSPHWASPDNIANVLSRDVPLWVIGAILALSALIAYVGFEWASQRNVDQALAPFGNIVQLAPHAPTLTITLP